MQTHVKVLGILFLISAGCLAFFAVAFPLGLSIVGMSWVNTEFHSERRSSCIDRLSPTSASRMKKKARRSW